MKLNMGCFSGLDMSSCQVLMSAGLSLEVGPRPLPPLDRLVPPEDRIWLCATRHLRTGDQLSIAKGEITKHTLPADLPFPKQDDVRLCYGGYDTLDERSRRISNWVRFLKVSTEYSHEINVIGRREGPQHDKVVFEIIRDVAVGEELQAFLIPPLLTYASMFLPTMSLLQPNIYKRELDYVEPVMRDAPLDLSCPQPDTKHSRRNSVSSEPDSSSSSPSSSPAPSVSSSSASPSPPQSSPSASPSPYEDSSIWSASASESPFFWKFSQLRVPPFYMKDTICPSTRSIQESPVFGNKSLSLTTHKKRERVMLPCPECKKSFDRPSLLKRHIRTHTGEKPHVCDICGKGFSTSSSLNTHRRIHSGEKPHQCNICGKRFTASSNLYYHKMTHIKEKPHKCNFCSRSFPTPGDLKSHMFTHNGQWPHKCSTCGKGFSKLNNLKNHELVHKERNNLPHVSISSSVTFKAESQDPPTLLSVTAMMV